MTADLQQRIRKALGINLDGMLKDNVLHLMMDKIDEQAKEIKRLNKCCDELVAEITILSGD